MRSRIAFIAIACTLSVCLVASSYASTLPVEQQTELSQILATPVVIEPSFLAERPATTGTELMSKEDIQEGVKPVPEPRSNSPGHRSAGT